MKIPGDKSLSASACTFGVAQFMVGSASQNLSRAARFAGCCADLDAAARRPYQAGTRLKNEIAARAFSLIEVMVATTIFFMAMFAILGVLCAGIHAATILRTSGPTAGMAAGYYYVTNKIEEGTDSGDFSDIAGYQGYQWRSSAVEVATNGLFHMEFVVIDPHGNPSSTLDVLIYNPNSSSSQHMGLQPQPH
jgi:hypothetical protein